MKKIPHQGALKGAVLALFFAALSFNADAQFSGVLQKAKQKAAEKAEKMMDGSSNKQTTTTSADQKTSTKIKINSGFDFVAGDTVLFAENFASTAVGAAPKTFKTNGAAVVVKPEGIADKWLALQDNASYRLARQYFFPAHFTVEFDLLAVADKIGDIYPVTFGFTTDNSISSYISSAGSYASLLYYNDHEVSVNSTSLSKYLSADFDLTNFTNRPMHVSIDVKGEQMAVYLEQTKIADTKAFLPGQVKNFYISAPMQYQNGSKLLVSNIRIAGFKADRK